mgnify:CR=1 FL=1
METKQNNQKENILVSILFNIVIPVLVLNKFSKIAERFVSDLSVSPIFILILALCFPIGYFLYDYVKRRKANFISILGFVSILLTGIIGVFEFPSEWIAFKEASVPFIIGLAVLISLKTPYPLVRKLLYNEEIMDVEKVDGILKATNQTEKFDKTLTNSTYLLAFSFLLSTILNFTLAKILIHSPSGTEAFNQEIAKMTALSYPVIALPSTIVMMFALWYLIRNLKKITGLTFEEMLAPGIRSKLEESEERK